MYSGLKDTNRQTRRNSMREIQTLEIKYLDQNRMKKQFMYKTINKQRLTSLIEKSTNEKRMWGFR